MLRLRGWKTKAREEGALNGRNVVETHDVENVLTLDPTSRTKQADYQSLLKHEAYFRSNRLRHSYERSRISNIGRKISLIHGGGGQNQACKVMLGYFLKRKA